MKAIQSGFVCVVLALAVGCGAGRPSDNACVGEACLEGGEVQTFCTRDDQCSADMYCAGGMCQPRSGGRPDDSCSTHNDCTVGRYCNILTGRCVDCLNQDHCDVGLVCRDDGTCGEEYGCTSNFDCGGLVCDVSSGNCVQCLTSADCPLGQTCRDQQCATTGGEDPMCETQADCDPYGRICDVATGHCLPCTTDIECGPGKICSAGTCTIDNGGGGGGGGGDGTCSSRDECAPQACSILLGMCMPCMMDFDCFDLMDLITGVSMICEPSTGNCIAPECATANDCPAGEACYDGHCGTCLYDDECRAGEVCNEATGVCEQGGGGTGGCTDHSECPDWCDVGSGDCVQCLLNGHCPTDYECSGGICVPSAPTGCTGDGDCPGQYCQSTTGACVDCLTNAQCGTGFTCTGNACVPESTGGGDGAFGDACAAQTDCDAGLTCLGDGTNGICSRTCIGSGNGGDADCPLGFACFDYEAGSLDGLKMCNAASQLPSDIPGQPFDQAPGASCAAYNGCQTSYCFSSSQVCGRGCSANRDCAGDEVCYATIDTYGDHMGYDLCFYSDTSQYTAAGGACTENYECDSGLCQGECSDGSPCNGTNDCTSCTGVCRDHCRSNADCAINESCNPWATQASAADGWVNICMPKYFDGSQADGTSCSADGDCASDWCIQSICTTPCAINADCTGALSSKVCDPITFVDSSQNPVYSLSFCL